MLPGDRIGSIPMGRVTTMMRTRSFAPRLLGPRLLAPALLLVLGLASGCYDSDALIEEVRSVALQTRLVEVDLGTYKTTMPRKKTDSETTEVELHIFGTVARYRVPEIETHLSADGFRLRHETLAAVRQTTAAELAEPNLTALRTRLEKVINDQLGEAPVKSIGFYEVKMGTR
jgi:hypothetical protein